MKPTPRLGGRPSKGPRQYVNVPLPLALAEKLARYSELTGEGKGPAVARVFEAHIEDLQLEEIEAQAAAERGQERLDFEATRRPA